MKASRFALIPILVCTIILIGWSVGQGSAAALNDDEKSNTEVQQEVQQVVQAEPLPLVGSFENFKKLMAEAERSSQSTALYSGIAFGMADRASAAAAPVPSANAAESSNKMISDQGGAQPDYSGTNVQVQGVDEADTVKTDGEYIYKINNNQLVVAKAYPAEDMEVISTLTYDKEVYPLEMYVDDQYLTVILNQNYYRQAEVYPADKGIIAPESRILPTPPFENSVKVLVYDLADRSNLKQVREIEIDGNYLSSRKIDDTIYLVNNKYIPIYMLRDQPESLTTPGYRDSLEGGEVKRIGYEEISYFPGSPQPNYLIVAGINLNDVNNINTKKTEVKTYLGSGQNIYSSLENLYVAVPEYQYTVPEYQSDEVRTLPAPADTAVSDSIAAPAVSKIIAIMPAEVNTRVYKFNLQEGDTKYLGMGSVPGSILNQFSMDEHNGYFRIATTDQNSPVQAGAAAMTNNLYILDQKMDVSGKIENIAPGEKIYSVRFIGDRGYMVTFKTVDPLFVLDLKNPSNPAILGELKIPGYSNYLHPYDENHIIGFGKEAIEVEEPHWSGEGTVKNAYYLGMKVALFDVSDVQNPKEKFKIEIGDRGTDSELFWNHKALLFDKEKNILAFPVSVYDIDPATIDKNDYLAQKDPRLAYGQQVFQGAFVYNLSLEQGFTLKGMITHQPEGKVADLQRSGRYDYNRDISRSLYIGDTLYTLSNGYLKANDLNTLAEQGGIAILK